MTVTRTVANGYMDTNDFVVKDSGARQSFAGGMVRDTEAGKLDIWRVYIGPMLRRWARHVTLGATKYPDVAPGVPNWTLAAGEEEMVRAKKSAARHFDQWMNEEDDEDHAAATFFNINVYETAKKRLGYGVRIGEEPTTPRLVSKVDGTDTSADIHNHRFGRCDNPDRCFFCGQSRRPEALDVPDLSMKGIGWDHPTSGFPS